MGKHGTSRTQGDQPGTAPAPSSVGLEIRAAGAHPPGKAQRAFNRLVRQLEGLRERLAQWQAFEPRYAERVALEMRPVTRDYLDERRALLRLLEALFEGRAAGGAPGKAERKQLRLYLLEVALAHLDEAPEDAEVIALHDRHADRPFAEERAAELQRTRRMAEEILGVEIDDDALDGSAEAIIAAGMDKAQQAQEERERHARERRQSEPRAAAREARKEAARQAMEAAASQSVREVFRKLASALHPDRAPDDAERERRHSLMQRANAAYEANDLLGLLTLQLETEQIDADHLARVPQARVEHYNAVLRDQIREIEDELEARVGDYAMLLDLPVSRVTIAAVERGFAQALSDAKRAIRELKDMRAILLQPAARKRWLREYAETRRLDAELEALQEEAFLDAALERVFQGLDPFDEDDGPSANRRGRGRRRRR